jgi:hypothetical protein
METRCNKSCQAFPKSGRAEVCGRCTKAATLCRNNTQVFDFEKGDTIEVKPGPRSAKSFTFVNKRFKSEKMIRDDERAGFAILRNQLLKPAHEVVKTIADFTKNPLRPDSTDDAIEEIIELLKNIKSWPQALAKATIGGLLDVFIANEAKKVAHARFVMYTHFAEGVVSVLDPSFKPKASRRYGAFAKMGIKAANSLSDFERYQLTIALIRQYCHSFGLGSCTTSKQFSLPYHKEKWNSSVFLRGMQREYQRNKWSLR